MTELLIRMGRLTGEKGVLPYYDQENDINSALPMQYFEAIGMQCAHAKTVEHRLLRHNSNVYSAKHSSAMASF